MANEATVFSMTTAEVATAVPEQAGGTDVDVATANAGSVTASTDICLYILKVTYEGDQGRNKLLRHLEKIKAKIVSSAWPAV